MITRTIVLLFSILLLSSPAIADSSNSVSSYCDEAKVDKLIEELNNITGTPLTEWSGERSGELIYELGECRASKSIPAMLNILGLAGGSSVVNAFAKMGPSIIEPLISKTRDQDKKLRDEAILYLWRTSEQFSNFGHELSTQDFNKIKRAIVSATRDKDQGVRQTANEILKKMAK